MTTANAAYNAAFQKQDAPAVAAPAIAADERIKQILRMTREPQRQAAANGK